MKNPYFEGNFITNHTAENTIRSARAVPRRYFHVIRFWSASCESLRLQSKLRSTLTWSSHHAYCAPAFLPVSLSRQTQYQFLTSWVTCIRATGPAILLCGDCQFFKKTFNSLFIRSRYSFRADHTPLKIDHFIFRSKIPSIHDHPLALLSWRTIDPISALYISSYVKRYARSNFRIFRDSK